MSSPAPVPLRRSVTGAGPAAIMGIGRAPPAAPSVTTATATAVSSPALLLRSSRAGGDREFSRRKKGRGGVVNYRCYCSCSWGSGFIIINEDDSCNRENNNDDDNNGNHNRNNCQWERGWFDREYRRFTATTTAAAAAITSLIIYYYDTPLPPNCPSFSWPGSHHSSKTSSSSSPPSPRLPPIKQQQQQHLPTTTTQPQQQQQQQQQQPRSHPHSPPAPPLPSSSSTTTTNPTPSQSQPSSLPAPPPPEVLNTRTALLASLANIVDRDLTSRAAQLHANHTSLQRQQRDVEKATAALRKTNDALESVVSKHSRAVLEIGDVQNWAEMCEREFLRLEDTLRRVRRKERRGGGEDDDGEEEEDEEESWSGSESVSGSWTGSDDEHEEEDGSGDEEEGRGRERPGEEQVRT
ncbi:hypothetical protein VTJ04DRAFT_8626 [Mycothermus thermophilus]|uniref:uncharacterized protein n=1 Tax=Humicola insolens TaxID=85995 RepID=UPI0037439270